MAAGVPIDPAASITIDDTVQLQPGVIIEPVNASGAVNTVIRSGSHIGPGSLIENSQTGENATVLYLVVRNSIVQAWGLKLVPMPICGLK